MAFLSFICADVDEIWKTYNQGFMKKKEAKIVAGKLPLIGERGVKMFDDWVKLQRKVRKKLRVGYLLFLDNNF